MFFHLFVVNQKELCVRSCLMANPDLQLLFSHTYLSFSAHPRTQSRCRCHNRAERLLLSVRCFYTARSLGLASSKANQPNKKAAHSWHQMIWNWFIDWKGKKQRQQQQQKHEKKKRKQPPKNKSYEIISCLLQPFWTQQPFGERFWEGKLTAGSVQYFFYLQMPKNVAKSSSAEETSQGLNNIFSLKKHRE